MEGLKRWEVLEKSGFLLSLNRPGACVVVHNDDDYDQKAKR
jgi:hypothetical protein